jgi:hypothetical protein
VKDQEFREDDGDIDSYFVFASFASQPLPYKEQTGWDTQTPTMKQASISSMNPCTSV